MSILSGREIVKQIELGNIVIDPFDPSFVGPNSVDVRLGPKLLRYRKVYEQNEQGGSWLFHPDHPEHLLRDSKSGRCTTSTRLDYPVLIDSKLPPEVVEVPLEDFGGWILEPRVLYLGETAEWTETKGFVPYIDGRSSLGRLGVFCHATAGRGDNGFRGRFTLELSVVEAVILYPGDRWFQLTYHTVEGEHSLYSGRYQDDEGPEPSKAFVSPGTTGKRKKSSGG